MFLASGYYKAYALRSRIDKWDFIKLQRTSVTERTLSIGPNGNPDCTKVFTNPKCYRGLISNTYKELKKLESSEPNKPIKNGVQSQPKNF